MCTVHVIICGICITTCMWEVSRADIVICMCVQFKRPDNMVKGVC